MNAQRGFNLIELMVAMTIALVVMAGVIGSMLTQKRNLDEQAQLAALQDDQRLALTVVAASIQSAGYYPDPTQLTRAAAFPMAPPYFTAPGQYLSGEDLGLQPRIAVRFLAGGAGAGGSGSDPMLGCDGTTAPPNGALESALQLDGDRLVCTTRVSGAPGATTVLVQRVREMRLTYGLDVNADGSVDSYASAAQVGNNWGKVLNVVLEIGFENPLKGAGQDPVLRVRRVINLKNALS